MSRKRKRIRNNLKKRAKSGESSSLGKKIEGGHWWRKKKRRTPGKIRESRKRTAPGNIHAWPGGRGRLLRSGKNQKRR